MISKRSILKELRLQGGVIFCVLFTIVLTMALVRTLGNAASGETPPDIVLPLILFSTFSSIGTIIALTAFLAVFITFTRLQNDNELVILRTSGMRIFDFSPTIIKFVFPLVIFTAITTLLATPWARQQADKLRLQAENDTSLKQYSAGRFSEFSKGNRIIFFERTEKESMKLGLVFVKIQTSIDKETIIMGTNGEITFFDEVPWVILRNGSRFDISEVHQTKDYQFTVFDTYQMSLSNPPKNYTLQKRIKSTDSLTLFNRSTTPELAELFMRIGIILLCAFLPFLAIPLSLGEGKALKILHIFTAILIFLAANHLLGILQALIIKGSINWLISQTFLPVTILILTLVISRYREGQLSIKFFQLKK